MRARVIAISALLALAIAGSAVAIAGGPRFGAYVACNAHSKKHATACSIGASPVAVFRAFRHANVQYKLCVRRPNRKVHCVKRKTTRKGWRSRTPINLVKPGSYRVTWFVHRFRIDTDRIRARAPRVYVVGDSLTVGTDPYLPGDLPGWPVTQSASISRHVPEGVALLRSKGSNLARIVVMALGTNDDPRFTTDFRQSVHETMRIAGAHRCVVWPNIVRPPVAGATYAGYNHVLARANRHFDNLFVVDWAAMAAAHPEWFGSDGVHPDATGYMARAAAIAAKVRACLH